MFVFVAGLSGGPDVVVLASPPKLGTCYLQIVAVTCYHFVGYYTTAAEQLGAMYEAVGGKIVKCSRDASVEIAM